MEMENIYGKTENNMKVSENRVKCMVMVNSLETKTNFTKENLKMIKRKEKVY